MIVIRSRKEIGMEDEKKRKLTKKKTDSIRVAGRIAKSVHKISKRESIGSKDCKEVD